MDILFPVLSGLVGVFFGIASVECHKRKWYAAQGGCYLALVLFIVAVWTL